MENKIPDIESLFYKLHSFEAEPNDSAWVVIQDKLNMGLDDLLEDLKEIEIEPDKKSEVFILAHLGFHNPVDVFLNDRFGSLEIDPEKSLDEIIPKNRNRRKAIVLFLSLIAIAIISMLTFEAEESNKTTEKVESKIQVDEKYPLSKLHNSQSSASESQSQIREKTTIRLNKKHSTSAALTADLISILPEDFGEVNSKIYPIKNTINYPLESIHMVGFRKMKLNKKPLPQIFQIVGGIGFQNQRLRNVQIENSEFQHKDAIDNYWRSTGKNILGVQFSAGISFNLSKKFYCRTSIQYQYMQSSNEFDYSYTDIPIYGIDGKIIGYFKRPISTSPRVNQDIKTTKQTVNMPVEAFYKVLNLNKTKVYAGLGLNIELNNQFKSSDFSFSKEDLSLLKIKTKHKLYPSLSFQYHYQINSQMKMILQIDGTKSSAVANFDGSTYHSTYFNSSISIGFSFIPKI